MIVQRKGEFRLYPNRTQEQAIKGYCGACRYIYNRGLEERKSAYESTGKGLSFAKQCKALTAWRKEEGTAWLAGHHTHALQGALKRLDLAFAAFFRRVKAGEKPGFPRFKSRHRFSGFGFKEHGNGWLLDLKEHAHGRVRITGIGWITLRGKTRFHGEPKTCEVIERAGKWYLSVTFAASALPQRKRTGHDRVGIDWGLETFTTAAKEDGTFDKQPNPRHLKKALVQLKAQQRALARKKNGSKRRQKQKRKVARLHMKVANRRKDFLHKLTTGQVARYSHIAVEKLSPLKMSARGGAHKKGLNRGILDAAAGMYHSLLRCKAEEAGSVYVEVDPRIHAPSQTCHISGRREKKPLSQRWHTLPSGERIGRDENAARVILQLSLGWEPSRRGEDGGQSPDASPIRETASRAA